MFEPINFPEYRFRLQETERKKMIFDVVRKKFVALTPEEWVRQHVIHYLLYDKGYPSSLLGVETAIRFNGMLRRCDLVVYRDDRPFLLVECKAPQVNISKEVIEQIARYQSVVKVPYLWISNGKFNLFLQINEGGKVEMTDTIPDWKF